MGKLSLKETATEKEEKEWRRIRKAARKAARYHLDDEPSSSSNTRKSFRKAPGPNGYDYVFGDDEEGWIPPPNAHRAATPQPGEDEEEEGFRAKLFDAMGMDAGQDSLQASFNEYVPPRWRDVSPTSPVPSRAKLHHLDDEEYVEYIRRGMWERTHQAEHAARQKKKADASEKRKRERELKEKTKEIEQEELDRRKRRREEKEHQHFLNAWTAYEKRWSDILKPPPASLPPNSLDFDNIPWPVFPPPTSLDSLNKDTIAAFLLSDKVPGASEKTIKQRLREAFLVFHPDRFESKVLAAVKDRDKERVREASGRVVRALNALAEQDR